MANPTKRILGIDPGLTRCGIGIIEGTGRDLRIVHVDTFKTAVDAPLENRLLSLEQHFTTLINEFNPDVVAVERVFAQHNVRTVMGTGQAAGIALLVAAKAELPVALHTPSEVKAAVTGSGRANKTQVADMVKRILNLQEIPKPVDSTDALALAICHMWRGAGNSLIESALKAEKTRIAKLAQR